MTTVHLSEVEVQQVVLGATGRKLRRADVSHRWGYDGSNHWTVEIEALAAELAVCKLLMRYWCLTDTPDGEGDVAPGVQVRHTTHRNGHLLVRPEDDDGHVFILVRGEIPTLEVVGWIRGGEAKRVGHLTTFGNGRPPVHAVPDSALKALRQRQ